MCHKTNTDTEIESSTKDQLCFHSDSESDPTSGSRCGGAAIGTGDVTAPCSPLCCPRLVLWLPVELMVLFLHVFLLTHPCFSSCNSTCLILIPPPPLCQLSLQEALHEWRCYLSFSHPLIIKNERKKELQKCSWRKLNPQVYSTRKHSVDLSLHSCLSEEKVLTECASHWLWAPR